MPKLTAGRLALPEALHVADNSLYKSHQLLKRWDQWQGRANVGDLKNYIDGNIEFLFEYATKGQSWQAKAVPDGWAQRPDHISATLTDRHRASDARGEVGDELAKIVGIDSTVICRRNQRAVLVRGVPVVEQIEQLVPTRFTVWPKANDEGKELWGNPVGQSVFHSFLKPCGRLGKGKLDSLSAPLVSGEGRDEFPIGVVERGPERLQDITADQGGLIYNGFVLFSVGGTLIGLCVCFEDVAEGLLFTEQFVDLSDVFRGPVDLETGAFH